MSKHSPIFETLLTQKGMNLFDNNLYYRQKHTINYRQSAGRSTLVRSEEYPAAVDCLFINYRHNEDRSDYSNLRKFEERIFPVSLTGLEKRSSQLFINYRLLTGVGQSLFVLTFIFRD